MEYGESSKGRKRYYDCARYAKLTPEQKKARQDRETARRQNLTLEQKQQMNARRRACLTSQKKQELNARRRVLRQSLPPEERQALLDRRKARYINKRNTVCHESIAMQCPELGASLIADPSLSTTPSTITKDDPATLFEDIMDEDTVPELSSSPPAHTSTSMPEFKIRTDGDLQNFINEMMDEDTIPEEDMDEEYYLFAGEGCGQWLNGGSNRQRRLQLLDCSNGSVTDSLPIRSCHHGLQQILQPRARLSIIVSTEQAV